MCPSSADCELKPALMSARYFFACREAVRGVFGKSDDDDEDNDGGGVL